MALAKKCDRCGQLYEHYPPSNTSQRCLILLLYVDEAQLVQWNTQKQFWICVQIAWRYLKNLLRREKRHDAFL